MRFYCENACTKQAAKCEFEFIVFAKGRNIVGTNFALFIVGHGLEEGKLPKRRKRRRSPERSLEKQGMFEKHLH